MDLKLEENFFPHSPENQNLINSLLLVVNYMEIKGKVMNFNTISGHFLNFFFKSMACPVSFGVLIEEVIGIVLQLFIQVICKNGVS